MARPIDRAAVDRLVVEHLPTALRFALRLTRDEQAAEEVVQEALVRVLRQWRTFRGEATFRSWLLSIVVNAERDRRRQRRIVEPIDDGDLASAAASPAELAAAGELRSELRDAIDRLPARQREVALLVWGEGLDPQEVAAALRITEANVYTTLHGARKRLAAALGVGGAGRISP